MEEQVSAPLRRPTRAKWIAGISMIVAGISALAVWAIASPNAIAYYKTPSELAAGQSTPGQNLRVGGRVAEGTLERDGTIVRFVVSDGHNQVPVQYTGDVPDTLKDETDVIAEGSLRGGTLHATRVLAKCSSKFVPVEDAEEQLGRKT
ncbi:MAG: cytochrome c maturation protein CcmE [Actinomycetota bacterium]